MSNLLDFLKKYSYWAVFALLEILAISMIIQYHSYHNYAWYTSANNVVAKINGIQHDIFSYIKLRDINSRLTYQNIILQKRVSELREQLKKTTKTESKTEQRLNDKLKGFNLIQAKVVSNSIIKNDNYITIDKGLADGIKPEDGCVCGSGIVGIVYLCSKHYSIIVPVINVKSNISCKVRGSNYFGSLQWRGGSPLYAYMVDVPRYSHVKVGQFVETSGYSSVFPAGLFIGRITKVEDAPDGLSLQLTVNLSTDFANLQDVNVVKNNNRKEILILNNKLMNAEQDNQ